VAGKVAATKDAKDFQAMPVGTLKIEKAGRVPLDITVTKLGEGSKNAGVMNLRSVTITPDK
jgi:hypothetical protein